MKNTLITGLVLLVILLASCDKEVRNIAGDPPPETPLPNISAEVNPVDINTKGFDLLENMQGQWVGRNRVIADDFDWFAFDYRPISPSHVFGIFEGGSMGNLFTSFFVTDYQDTRTIMARNGGLLNGLYRTSYFVLDSVSYDNNESFYRLIDAVGGARTMWMELRFTGDSLYFNAYTSRLGQTYPPARHMTFRARRNDVAQAQAAADAVGFPENVPAWDFSGDWKFLYSEIGQEPLSATFLWEGNQDVWTLAPLSGDPWTISDIPHLGVLQVDIEKNPLIDGKRYFLFLSKEPLTDAAGALEWDEDAWDTVQLFPELSNGEDQFVITYLHPGDYYLTLIADANNDFYPGPGDVTHPLQSITIDPSGEHQITLSNITVQN